MATARKAPPGFTWRPSTLEHLRRVLVLEREANADLIGSVGPVKRGKWMNRDTGELFDTLDSAQADVEQRIL